MDTSDYKPNSHVYKESQKKQPPAERKVEKIVKGKVKTKKKSGVTKLADVFISEDANNVKSYVLMDVLVPAIKKAISDIVTDGIDMILYGGTGGGRRGNRTNASNVSYRKFYDDRRDERRYSSNTGRRAGYNYDDIILDTRSEAEHVLSRMDELIDTYGMVTVADLYDLVGISGEYTDNRYGWTNIRNADVVKVRDGWLIKLPKAFPLD